MNEATARMHCRARDHNKCRVPGCAQHAGHLHHVIFRSQSKALQWETSNLLSLCAGHHALVHAGLLTITGNADEEVTVEGDDFDMVARACGEEG